MSLCKLDFFFSWTESSWVIPFYVNLDLSLCSILTQAYPIYFFLSTITTSYSITFNKNPYLISGGLKKCEITSPSFRVLKGKSNKIFNLHFFHHSNQLGPLTIGLKYFQKFSPSNSNFSGLSQSPPSIILR